MAILTDPQAIRAALQGARTVAILGAHTDARKAARYVPDYLAEAGYRLFPVNPRLIGQTLWDEPVRATLAELDTPVDMVDVFRRSEHLPDHLDDILAMNPAPTTVWLQSGVRHDAVATALAAAGLDVIQSRCTMADHRRFGLARRGAGGR